MTNPQPPVSELDNARAAAAAHTAASRDLETFLNSLSATPTPADITEYASLLAREEILRARRQEASDALGLMLESLESSD